MLSNFSNSFIIIINFNTSIFNLLYYLKIPTLLSLSSTSTRLSSIFFNRLNNLTLANPSVNTLPIGEYSNFTFSTASGLYPKSFLVKYSYLGKSPQE